MARSVPHCACPPRSGARWAAPFAQQVGGPAGFCDQRQSYNSDSDQLAHGRAGTMGLKGNLSGGEIVEQLVHAMAVTPIHNVVFMVSHWLGPPTPDSQCDMGSLTRMSAASLP